MSGTADALMALDLAGVPANDPRREELLQQMVERGRGTVFQGGGIAPGAVSEVTPIAKDVQGQNTWQLPGIAYDLYERFGKLLPAVASGLTNFANAPTGEEVTIPDIPGTESAKEHLAGATRWALENVPHPKPETEKDVQDLASGVNIGQAISPVVPMSLYARAPSAVGNIGRWFVPATQDVLPIVAITKGAQQLSEPKEQPATPDDSNVVPTAAPPTPVQPLSAQPFDVRPPEPSLSAPPPQAQDTGWTPAQVGATILAGGAATWAVLKYGPRVVNDIADVVRGLRGIPTTPEGVSRTLDDIAAGRNINTGIGTQTPSMPLPGNASGVTRRTAAYWQNENAVVDEIDKAVATSKQEADAMVAQNHQINQQGSMNTRMESQMRTGMSPTGRQGPSMIDNRMMVDQMTDGQRQVANWAAWARNELRNRADPARGGNPTTYGGIPLTLQNLDTNALLSMRAAGDADPAVKAWLDHWDDTVKFVRQDAELSGMITPGQAARGANLYPEWMPTVRQDGSVMHSWDPRHAEQVPGWTLPPTNAWDAQAMWYDRAYRDMQHNAWMRDRILRYDNFGQLNPEYRGMLTWADGPSETASRLTIYTSAGPRYVDVNNPWLYRTLKGGPTQIGNVAAWTAGFRRLLTSGVVGPLSAIGGNIFALKHMARYMIAGGSQLGPQLYKGYLDRALKQAIGHGVPWDPTVLYGVPRTAIGDMGSAFAKNFGDTLASSSHPITASLRPFIGQSGIDAWRDWLYHRYNTSNLGQRTAAGVSGGGSYGIREVTPRVFGEAGATAANPLHNVAPILDKNHLLASTSNPLGTLGQSVGRGLVTSSINLRSLIRDLHGAVLDAVNGFAYDLNRQNPAIMQQGRPNTRMLGHMAQSMIGDPATMGASTWARGIARSVPLANIGMQAMAATLRSFRDHPVNWSLGATIPMFLLSLGSQLSAITSGQDHVDYLQNHMSDQQKEANAIFFHGKGTTPDQHTELSLPQPFRWLYPYVNALTASALGVFRSDGLSLQSLEHMLSEFFSSHVSTSTVHQMGLGGTEALEFPLSVPPAGSAAIAALTGRDPGRIGSSLVENVQQDRPLTQGIATGPTPSRIPGQEERGILNSIINEDSLRGVLQALVGSVGGTVLDLVKHGYERWDQTHDADWVIRGLKSDYAQTLAEQNKETNIIWNAHLPMSVHGPIDEQVNRSVANIRATINAEDDILHQGLTRKGGLPVQVTGSSPVPDDPQMQQVYITMGRFAKQMEQRSMPQISDLYKELQTLKDSPMMADEKRRIANEINMKISAQKQELAGHIEGLNEFLSQMVGKNIDVSKRIDWKKGVEQFR